LRDVVRRFFGGCIICVRRLLCVHGPGETTKKRKKLKEKYEVDTQRKGSIPTPPDDEIRKKKKLNKK
jgi:hypothetical protein